MEVKTQNVCMCVPVPIVRSPLAWYLGFIGLYFLRAMTYDTMCIYIKLYFICIHSSVPCIKTVERGKSKLHHSGQYTIYACILNACVWSFMGCFLLSSPCSSHKKVYKGDTSQSLFASLDILYVYSCIIACCLKSLNIEGNNYLSSFCSKETFKCCSQTILTPC